MQKVAAPLIGANDDVEAIEGKRNYYRASKQVFERELSMRSIPKLKKVR